MTGVLPHSRPDSLTGNSVPLRFGPLVRLGLPPLAVFLWCSWHHAAYADSGYSTPELKAGMPLLIYGVVYVAVSATAFSRLRRGWTAAVILIAYFLLFGLLIAFNSLNAVLSAASVAFFFILFFIGALVGPVVGGALFGALYTLVLAGFLRLLGAPPSNFFWWHHILWGAASGLLIVVTIFVSGLFGSGGLGPALAYTLAFLPHLLGTFGHVPAGTPALRPAAHHWLILLTVSFTGYAVVTGARYIETSGRVPGVFQWPAEAANPVSLHPRPGRPSAGRPVRIGSVTMAFRRGEVTGWGSSIRVRPTVELRKYFDRNDPLATLTFRPAEPSQFPVPASLASNGWTHACGAPADAGLRLCWRRFWRRQRAIKWETLDDAWPEPPFRTGENRAVTVARRGIEYHNANYGRGFILIPEDGSKPFHVVCGENANRCTVVFRHGSTGTGMITASFFVYRRQLNELQDIVDAVNRWIDERRLPEGGGRN